MTFVPPTRNSLILRLHDPQDTEAWDEFVEIYEPLVYRLAKRKGLQDSDATDVTQEVMIAVAGAVERWEPDTERGRLRNWLFRVARNQVIKTLTRRKHRAIGSGDSAVHQMLHQQPDADSIESDEFDLEYHREVFRWAAKRVRKSVTPSTWTAFWRTSIQGESIASVASSMSITVGAVHIARSRVRAKLREEVRRYEQKMVDQDQIEREG